MSRPGPTENELKLIYETFDETNNLAETARRTGINKSTVIRAVYKRAGRCACGSSVVEGMVTCQRCLDNARRGHNRRYSERKATSVCVFCTKPLANNSATFCDEHLRANNEKSKQIREKRRSLQVCLDCEEPLADDSARYCAKHAIYHAAAHAKHKMGGNWLVALERDAYHCVICHRGIEHARLEVHHIDFDKSNNALANLVTLCLPCHHALTDLINCPDRNSLIEFVKLNYS